MKKSHIGFFIDDFGIKTTFGADLRVRLTLLELVNQKLPFRLKTLQKSSASQKIQ